jgi:hypothetical protein
VAVMLAALAAAQAPSRLDGDTKRLSDGGLFSPFSFCKCGFFHLLVFILSALGEAHGQFDSAFEGGSALSSADWHLVFYVMISNLQVIGFDTVEY